MHVLEDKVVNKIEIDFLNTKNAKNRTDFSELREKPRK